MRALAIPVFLLLFLSLANSYAIRQTREEMLDYYYRNIDEKIPKSARMLIGDEKVNVYIAGQPLGIETRRGYLYAFEKSALENPTIIVKVSQEAADKITKKEMGILQAIESGEIRIEAKNFFSAMKVEAMKRIYAVSGADDQILGKKKPQADSSVYSSIYLQRARIAG
jgi:putative sterol carrier protein